MQREDMEMPIKLPMNAKFMYWGTSQNNLTLAVPYPSSGAFESARTVTTQESSNGEIVAQLVGRTRDKQNMKWNVMDCEKWWEINNWLEDNIISGGIFSFYCKYFNFNLGKWQVHQCYVGNPSCTPFAVNSDETSEQFGMPRFLRDCTLNVIDCGIVEDEE